MFCFAMAASPGKSIGSSMWMCKAKAGDNETVHWPTTVPNVNATGGPHTDRDKQDIRTKLIDLTQMCMQWSEIVLSCHCLPRRR